MSRRSAWLARMCVVSLLMAACVSPPTRDLSDLVLQDSTYYTPETMEPYTGNVVRHFPTDPGKVQLRGTLRDGTWNGELTVYHANGRVRYMGILADGEKCGAWTENQDPEPPENVYEDLKQEIESMGLYPQCPEF